MNFLGHAWFTGREDDFFLTGNVFGDFLKGSVSSLSLPEGILRGLRYHRFLDQEGDKCRGFVGMKTLLGHDFGHFRGVITDVFIDHFLAIHWLHYHQKPLDVFAADTYKRMAPHIPVFPPHTARAFHYMQTENWFVMNKSSEHIFKTLHRVGNRLGSGEIVSAAGSLILDKREEFDVLFHEFMEELIHRSHLAKNSFEGKRLS